MATLCGRKPNRAKPPLNKNQTSNARQTKPRATAAPAKNAIRMLHQRRGDATKRWCWREREGKERTSSRGESA